jgi:hypothetical protein
MAGGEEYRKFGREVVFVVPDRGSSKAPAGGSASLVGEAPYSELEGGEMYISCGDCLPDKPLLSGGVPARSDCSSVGEEVGLRFLVGLELITGIT